MKDNQSEIEFSVLFLFSWLEAINDFNNSLLTVVDVALPWSRYPPFRPSGSAGCTSSSFVQSVHDTMNTSEIQTIVRTYSNVSKFSDL